MVRSGEDSARWPDGCRAGVPRLYIRVTVSAVLAAMAVCHAWSVPPTARSGREDSMPERRAFRPGALWPDADGAHINAHGGGILYRGDTYYWFGEKRAARASEGINVYSSQDLYTWRYGGVALAPVADPEHDIARGCVMERPKVLFNEKTRKYVMWFHLELKGQGYSAARAAVGVSDTVTGPYTFLKSFRPNGNMSRDMTLFKDDDGTAYHIYASRDNFDMRVCRLSDDYLSPTGQDVVIHSDHREAPAVFKHGGKYYLITSACTGWRHNAARLDEAASIWGPWSIQGNPVRGPEADTTYDSQSTYVLPVPGRDGAFIFMADRWNPRNLADSRYIWLPIRFEDGKPAIEWLDEWDLRWFDDGSASRTRQSGRR
jgi:beta-galactosidase